MKKNILFSLILGIGVSAAGLYLAFRNVPFSELIIYLTSIDYFWILPAVLAGLISFMLRVLRWQIILESSQKINFWGAFHPLMIGFMLNCMLPGRAGEVARPVILQKKNKVPFSTGLATVAAERVFDISILIIFFSVAFASVEIDPNLNIPFGDYNLNRETLKMIGGGMLKLTGVLITGMIMVSFSGTRRIINGGIMGIPSLFFFAGPSFKTKIKEKICTVLVGFMENFASGFALVRSPKKIGLCIGLSVFVWALQALSYYVFSLGCPGIALSYTKITTVMLIICVFIALPSVPGFWGLWEAGGIFALSLFGVLSKDAAGYTLANHAIQVFPVIIVGFVSAMITGVNIWQVSYEK
ncbi:lysylphosphatidylglycerol synthase transmembrane domain-containing protein [Desulfonema magnum]|uniref:TIGR00374 family protein n=1 Tax=Desulfonema magnum TaxID=45655 RepID=A0A975BGW5_9BACT|nr:lysylphosphatidylglycerol synthase transmembrane domain-containing protein [Desulfonema magnum]QTA85161.1 TIGR00374 family protein [Desulfonema magnum]